MNCLDTLTLFGVVIRLFREDDLHLGLRVFLGDKEVFKITFKVLDDVDRYMLEDIGSGESDDGVYYLSLAVSADTSSILPEYRTLALSVDADGESRLIDLNPYWTDSETEPYYEFNTHIQQFQVRR